MIKFWLPINPYSLVEVLIPPRAIDMLLRIAVHEIGHAEVALHFSGRVLGIAFEQSPIGLKAQAIYEISTTLPSQDRCTIFAAGSAGELLVYGNYTAEGASEDLIQMTACDAEANYEASVERAKVVLSNRRARFDRLSEVLKSKLNSNDELTMGILPIGRMGAFILNEVDFA